MQRSMFFGGAIQVVVPILFWFILVSYTEEVRYGWSMSLISRECDDCHDYSSWHECKNLQQNRAKQLIQNSNLTTPRIVLICHFGLFFGFKNFNTIINYCFHFSLLSLTTCRFFVNNTSIPLWYFKYIFQLYDCLWLAH